VLSTHMSADLHKTVEILGTELAVEGKCVVGRGVQEIDAVILILKDQALRAF